LRITEYAGHFHLYSWLQNAIGRQCVVSPEFPTGNGRVDLHLKCGEKSGIIEVKSFTDLSELTASKGKAANYAVKTGLTSVTIAVFVPESDEKILQKLSGDIDIGGICVSVCAIGWV